MPSIYKDSQGYWNAQVKIGYYANGKRKYKRFRAATKKEVQKKMDEYMLDTKNLAVIPEDEGQSVGEYIKMYIDVYKSGSLKPSSLTRDYGILNNQINPCIGGFQLSKLTTNDVQKRLINQLKDKGYSLSTIHKAYTLLNESLNKAVQEKKILFNPCTGVELPSKNILIPKQIEILTDDEIELFIKAANCQKVENSLAILLVLYTGLRAGELGALHWEDVDFDNRTLNVHRNIGISNIDGKRVTVIQEGTKTKLRRTVPLNQQAISLLHQIQSKSVSKLIITSKAEVPQVSTIGQQYDRILKYAGIKGRTGIHTLRHTFASQCLKKGIDIKVISEILGHSSVSFTYNTYVHLMPEQKKNALDLLDY